MSKPATDKGVINPNAFRARGQVPERIAWVGPGVPLRVLAQSSSLWGSQGTTGPGLPDIPVFQEKLEIPGYM